MTAYGTSLLPSSQASGLSPEWAAFLMQETAMGQPDPWGYADEAVITGGGASASASPYSVEQWDAYTPTETAQVSAGPASASAYGSGYSQSYGGGGLAPIAAQPTFSNTFTRSYDVSGPTGYQAPTLSPEWAAFDEQQAQQGSPDLTAMYDEYFAQQGYDADPGSRVMAGSPAALEQQVREQYGRELAAAYEAGLISDAEYRAQAANLAGRSSGDGYGLRALTFPFQQYENLQNLLGGGTILPDWMGGPTWNEGINAATDFAAEGLRPSDTLRNIPVLGTVLDAPATVADFIRPRGLLDVAVEAGPGGFIFDAARGTGRAAPPPARIGEALPSLPDAKLLRNPLLEVPQYSDEMAQVYNRTAGIAGVAPNLPTRQAAQLPFGTQMAGGADETLDAAANYREFVNANGRGGKKATASRVLRDGSREEVQVWDVGVPGLSVWKPYATDTQWQILHNPTGKGVAEFSTRADATAAARALGNLGDWQYTEGLGPPNAAYVLDAIKRKSIAPDLMAKIQTPSPSSLPGSVSPSNPAQGLDPEWVTAVRQAPDASTRANMLEFVGSVWKPATDEDLVRVLDMIAPEEDEVGSLAWQVAHAVSKNPRASAQTQARAAAMYADWTRPGRDDAWLATLSPEELARVTGRSSAPDAPVSGGAIGDADKFPSASSASPPLPPTTAVPPAGGSPTPPSGNPVPGNQFVGDLRPFDEVQAEVITSENPIVRAIMGRTGINPSVVENSDVGKALTAYMRQRVATDELTSTAVAAALDPHAARFTGGMSRVLPISDDGLMTVTRNGVRGSAPWQDVFSAPGRFNLTDETLGYVDDYRRVLDEVEALRVSHGLEPRAMNREGYFYTPRQVKGIRGVEITRPSKANLSRVYEDAVDGFANGVRYDADPRATLDLHVRNAYREIAEKQLSDALEPISMKPSDLIPAPIKTRLETAIKNKRAAEQAFRREAYETQRALTETLGADVARAQRELTSAEASLARVQGEIAARQTRKQAPVSLGRRLQQATQRVERARQNLADFQRAGRNVPRGKAGAARMVTDDTLIQRVEQAREQFNAAKNAYIKAGERARNASVADAAFFGGNQGDTIPIAQWRNRFFKKDDAEQLAEAIGRFSRKGNVTAPAWAAEQAGKAINYVRFLSSVGDFGAPFIQGMPVLARDPVAWAKATANHYKAFVDPRVQSRFIREHIDTFQEMARHGVPIGDPEFFRATEAGGGFTLPMPGNVRKVTRQAAKQTTGRFSAAYGTFLGDSRALLWESSKLAPADRAQYIRNMTGGLDPRALRVSPEQRAVEGMWLAFSPRLMRSTMALVKDAMNPTTPVGRESLRTLGQLATGATGLYIAAGLALGKDWDDIENGLNPLNGKKFLSHEVNGDWIGIGGQIRAIAQLIGKSAADPQGLLSDSFYDNPLISYFGGRGAPAVNIGGAVVEAVTGLNTSPFERIDGLPDLLKHIGTSALPFALQGILEGENVLTSIAAFFGGRTSPETTNERLTRQSADAIDKAIAEGAFPADAAEALKGLTFSDLTSRERLALENFARETGNDDLLATLKQREKELRENRSIFQLKRDEVDDYWARYSNQMDGMYEALFSGTMSATDVRERLRKLQQDARTLYDLDMEYQEAVSKLPERDINKAMDEYYSLYDRIQAKYGQVDRNLLDAAQEAYLKRVESENPTLAARVRFNLQEQTDPSDHKLVKIFDAAQPLFDEYYSVDEKERAAFRVANPRTDYLLWLLGYVTTVRSQEAADLARQTTSREVKVIE